MSLSLNHYSQEQETSLTKVENINIDMQFDNIWFFFNISNYICSSLVCGKAMTWLWPKHVVGNSQWTSLKNRIVEWWWGSVAEYLLSMFKILVLIYSAERNGGKVFSLLRPRYSQLHVMGNVGLKNFLCQQCCLWIQDFIFLSCLNNCFIFSSHLIVLIRTMLNNSTKDDILTLFTMIGKSNLFLTIKYAIL